MDKLIYLGEPWPSLNVLMGWHPGRRHSWAKKFARTAGPLLIEAGLANCPDHTVKAIMRLYRCTGRELDHDNLWGGAKVVVDSMKRKPMKGTTERTWGLYWDDAPTWLELHVAQIKACPDDRPGTYMNIEWTALSKVETLKWENIYRS